MFHPPNQILSVLHIAPKFEKLAGISKKFFAQEVDKVLKGRFLSISGQECL